MIEKGEKSMKSFVGKGVFPARYAFTLLLPFRNIFLSPKKLIQRLCLEENFCVLEIGPGPGYFSAHISKKLKVGKLVLLDIQQEMLDKAKKRLDKKRINNVIYRLANGVDFEFESRYFDRIFMVTVLGEVENKDNYLKEINRTLKGNGVLSVSELIGDPDRISVDELKSLVCSHGFEVSRMFVSKLNYTINFKKRNTT